MLFLYLYLAVAVVLIVFSSLLLIRDYTVVCTVGVGLLSTRVHTKVEQHPPDAM